jgi:hypothetical protein
MGAAPIFRRWLTLTLLHLTTIRYSRFMELTKDASFWPNQLIYRNIPRFLAQFGVCADAQTSHKVRGSLAQSSNAASPRLQLFCYS